MLMFYSARKNKLCTFLTYSFTDVDGSCSPLTSIVFFFFWLLENSLYHVWWIPVPWQLPVSGARPAGVLSHLLLLYLLVPARAAAAAVEAQREGPESIHLILHQYQPQKQWGQQPDLKESAAAGQEQEQRDQGEEEEEGERREFSDSRYSREGGALIIHCLTPHEQREVHPRTTCEVCW